MDIRRIHSSHRNRFGCTTGSRDPLAAIAAVAGGHHNNHTLIHRPVHFLRQRVGVAMPEKAPSTQTHIDHPRMLGNRPLDAGVDIGLQAVALIVAHFADDQLSARTDAERPRRGGSIRYLLRTLPGDNARNVRAMTDGIGFGTARKVLDDVHLPQ